jgi:hypothetical protein
MAKKKHFVGLFIAVIIGLVFSSTGCATTGTPITGQNPFLGTWDAGLYGTIVFKSDGTGKQGLLNSFTYTVDGNSALLRAGLLKIKQTAVINNDNLIYEGVTFKKKE